MKRLLPTSAPRPLDLVLVCSLACLTLVSAFAACASPGANETPPSPERLTGSATPSAPRPVASATPRAPSSTAAPVPAPITALVPSPNTSAGEVDAGAPDASGGAAASAPSASPQAKEAEALPIDPENKTKPQSTSEELNARAKALFEAIVKNEPALGDPFWFPKEPFIPLKDVKGPEKYWKNLHAAYAEDIRKVHRKRKSWEGAKFKSFEIGSTPKWVKPGDEANKIGYYRSFRGKLRYELEGETYTIEVHTVITWQGRWYVTHLLKFKK
jgi:hypothetical protein